MKCDKLRCCITQSSDYSTVCDSSLGRIGSLLLGSVAERCQQVSQAVRLIEVGCPHFELIVPGILTRQEFTVGLC